ncbi:DUF1257 domain-containing protein [Pelotomaculum propionicicum]|uniref:DUF1257 domain-containing protein n=1 Tax=Pelotomaculum propionicicum TaxID=258475 RepID=UPI003B7DC8E7
MSHFTTVKTQIKELTLLKAAMKALNLQMVERQTVNGYMGNKTTADAVWQVSDNYDVGAIKNADGTFDLVGDWWGTSMTIPMLEQKIPQEYAVQNVLRRAKLMGHQVAKENRKDGSVRLVVRTGV